MTSKMDVSLTLYMPEEEGEKLADLPEMRPMYLIAEAPYAEFVEFGVLPSKNRIRGNGSKDRGAITSIKEWAMRKLGLEEAEAQKLAYKVYSSTLKNGRAPMPFFRPALWDTFADAGRDGCGSLEEFGDKFVERAQRYVDELKLTDTGKLKDSIKWEHADDADTGAEDANNLDPMWMSDRVGRNDMEPSERWRRPH